MINLMILFHWRAYSINPLNSQINKKLKYTEHPLFYVKMKKIGPNKYIFDNKSTVISERIYGKINKTICSRFLSDSKEKSLTTFLGSLGMGIILDSWDCFCKTLDQDSCKLYSFCANKKNNDKCGLGKIGNLDGNNPYQGVSDELLKYQISKNRYCLENV